MKTIHCYAPAKINLTLDVKSKVEAEDLFHPLETIYHRIDLVDEMTLTESANFEVVGDFDCESEDNLITKAYELITQYINDAPKVRVKVQKNIPIGSGLGGGSSNFATFVKLYFKLFSLGPVPRALIEQSGHIGKDIPFFFQASNCALGTGFGEIIEPLDFDFSGTQIYLYVPKINQLTHKAYGRLKTFDTSFTRQFLNKISDVETSQWGVSTLDEYCGNSFDECLPDLPNKDKIHLTGSGSAFYSFEDLGAISGCRLINAKLL